MPTRWQGLLGIMIDEGMVTRYDEGPDVVYAIEQEQHAVASYYRNTIIHFFVNKAIIELALLKTSETEGAAALEVFWSEVDQLRDLFKFEFFYAPTEQFHQQIREELARYAENWEELLQQGASGLPAAAEQYAAAGLPCRPCSPLPRPTPWWLNCWRAWMPAEILTEEQCVSKALKLGHQAYLQRRISSPSSIGKLLFKNGFKMAEHRKLTAGGGKEVASGRKALAMEIRDVLRRLELIRALNVATRGTHNGETIMTNLKVGVLGGGSWGTTVASLVTRNAPVTLWARNPETVEEINTLHTNCHLPAGRRIPEKLVATNDIGEAVSGADVVVMGIPSQNFRQVLTEVRQHIRAWVPVISLTKGLELDSHMRMTEIITEVMPGHPVGVLTGPNLAREIMAGQAAASVIAMEDDIIVRELQSVFKSGLFRVYTNNDVIGCELGGVLKNIIAIAVGMGDGQGAGDNTRSALITRGLAEVTRLGVAMGGRAETFAGLAGMGDMIATCTSPQSRNRHVGVELGKGRNMQEIVDEMVMVAEGAKSAPAVMALAEKYGVEMPIASDVYRVLSRRLQRQQGLPGPAASLRRRRVRARLGVKPDIYILNSGTMLPRWCTTGCKREGPGQWPSHKNCNIRTGDITGMRITASTFISAGACGCYSGRRHIADTSKFADLPGNPGPALRFRHRAGQPGQHDLRQGCRYCAPYRLHHQADDRHGSAGCGTRPG